IGQVPTSLVDHANSNVPSVLASLTKGGLNAATKSLAIEYAKKGIRVNAVAPGVIKTPMHAPETHEFLANLHPVGRMGEARDIVDAVLFLEGAGFVTGEILHVDGGQSAGHSSRRHRSRQPRTTNMPIVTIKVTREGTAPGAVSVTPAQKAA